MFKSGAGDESGHFWLPLTMYPNAARLSSLPKATLEAMCRERGLRTSGTKNELAQTLFDWSSMVRRDFDWKPLSNLFLAHCENEAAIGRLYVAELKEAFARFGLGPRNSRVLKAELVERVSNWRAIASTFLLRDRDAAELLPPHNYRYDLHGVAESTLFRNRAAELESLCATRGIKCQDEFKKNMVAYLMAWKKLRDFVLSFQIQKAKSEEIEESEESDGLDESDESDDDQYEAIGEDDFDSDTDASAKSDLTSFLRELQLEKEVAIPKSEPGAAQKSSSSSSSGFGSTGWSFAASNLKPVSTQGFSYNQPSKFTYNALMGASQQPAASSSGTQIPSFSSSSSSSFAGFAKKSTTWDFGVHPGSSTPESFSGSRTGSNGSSNHPISTSTPTAAIPQLDTNESVMPSHPQLGKLMNLEEASAAVEERRSMIHDLIAEMGALIPPDLSSLAESFFPLLDLTGLRIKRVGLYGASGVGKTTLVNKILGIQSFLPIGVGGAVTSSITEIRASPNPNCTQYSILVYFISEDEWLDSIEAAKQQIELVRQDEPTSTVLPPLVQILIHQLRAIKKESLCDGNFKDGYAWEKENPKTFLPPNLVDFMKQGYLEQCFTNLSATKELLAKYCSAEEQYWPIVSRIVITGPFEFLRECGITLLDIPGTDDGNHAFMTRCDEAVSRCDVLYYVGSCTRGASGATVGHILSKPLGISSFGILFNKMGDMVEENPSFAQSGALERHFKEKMKNLGYDGFAHQLIDETPLFFFENKSSNGLFEDDMKRFKSTLTQLEESEDEFATNQLIAEFNRNANLFLQVLEGQHQNPLAAKSNVGVISKNQPASPFASSSSSPSSWARSSSFPSYASLDLPSKSASNSNLNGKMMTCDASHITSLIFGRSPPSLPNEVQRCRGSGTIPISALHYLQFQEFLKIGLFGKYLVHDWIMPIHREMEQWFNSRWFEVYSELDTNSSSSRGHPAMKTQFSPFSSAPLRLAGHHFHRKFAQERESKASSKRTSWISVNASAGNPSSPHLQSIDGRRATWLGKDCYKMAMGASPVTWLEAQLNRWLYKRINWPSLIQSGPGCKQRMEDNLKRYWSKSKSTLNIEFGKEVARLLQFYIEEFKEAIRYECQSLARLAPPKSISPIQLNTFRNLLKPIPRYLALNSLKKKDVEDPSPSPSSPFSQQKQQKEEKSPIQQTQQLQLAFPHNLASFIAQHPILHSPSTVKRLRGDGPGFLYILSNKAYEGQYKVGYTAKTVEKRARDLYSTGVIHPFVIEHKLQTTFQRHLEKCMHWILKDVRVRKNREFFEYPLPLLIELSNLLLVEVEKGI